MATWVVGDVHGCAAELARLLAELGLAREDELVMLGDLFHRGPDPLGVVRLLRGTRARFVLGNHEHALLARLAALAPGRGPTRDDLRGDSGRPLELAPERAGELLDFLRGHAGFAVSSDELVPPSATRDGRPWCAVHAGITPGKTARTSETRDLLYPARLAGGRGAFWYEEHAGPELVLFGHLVQPRVLRVERDGRCVALGLDTGVLYGGELSAYCPETDELRSVRAARVYVRR